MRLGLSLPDWRTLSATQLRMICTHPVLAAGLGPEALAQVCTPSNARQHFWSPWVSVLHRGSSAPEELHSGLLFLAVVALFSNP